MDITLMEHVTGEFGAYLSEVTDGDLATATPCEGWSIGDLARHMIDENIRVGQAADPRSAPPVMVSSWVPCDPVHGSSPGRERAYRDSARYALDALARADLARSGPPAEDAFGLHLASTLIHTWDLASALQFDFDLPEARAVERALHSMRQLPLGARGGGKPFGTIVGDFPAISAVDELLVLSGRSPAWRAPLR